MTTTSIREAIRERLDPIIEEIVAREISERGGGYYTQRQAFGQPSFVGAQQPFGAIAPVLLSALMGQQQPGVVGGQQQPFGALTPVLLSVLMGQQQQPGMVGAQQQHPLWALTPILLSTLMTQQQQYGGVVGQQHPLGALVPVLIAALSTSR